MKTYLINPRHRVIHVMIDDKVSERCNTDQILDRLKVDEQQVERLLSVGYRYCSYCDPTKEVSP